MPEDNIRVISQLILTGSEGPVCFQNVNVKGSCTVRGSEMHLLKYTRLEPRLLEHGYLESSVNSRWFKVIASFIKAHKTVGNSNSRITRNNKVLSTLS